jgi:hypothetical protein
MAVTHFVANQNEVFVVNHSCNIAKKNQRNLSLPLFLLLLTILKKNGTFISTSVICESSCVERMVETCWKSNFDKSLLNI